VTSGGRIEGSRKKARSNSGGANGQNQRALEGLTTRPKKRGGGGGALSTSFVGSSGKKQHGGEKEEHVKDQGPPVRGHVSERENSATFRAEGRASQGLCGGKTPKKECLSGMTNGTAVTALAGTQVKEAEENAKSAGKVRTATLSHKQREGLKGGGDRRNQARKHRDEGSGNVQIHFPS